jgi:uncharacterized membrane protein
MPLSEVKEKSEELIKNRAKFEWAILAVIGFYVTNYFLKGEDPPDGMLLVFGICILTYVILFIMDLIVPVLKQYLDQKAHNEPPAWVVNVLEVVDRLTLLIDKIPVAFCRHPGVEEPGGDPPVY